MTSPPRPLLPIARLPTTPQKFPMLAEIAVQGPQTSESRSSVLDSKPVATSLLSALSTYTSIRLDADGTSRRLIWHLPVRLSNWEY